MHTLTIEGAKGTLHVVHFTGVEALGELFSFDVAFVAPDDTLDFSKVSGAKALLTIVSGPEPRYVHGVVARLEHSAPTKERGGYHVTILPSMHGMRLGNDSRIFQDKSVPDIAQQVLSEAGFSSNFRVALSGSYASRTYCVQYRESDWDFLMRILEEEGIHAYFEHSETGDKLVLADAPSAHTFISGEHKVPFRPESGALKSVDHVTRFTLAEEMRAGKSTVRDYDFKRPTLLLEATETGSADAKLEVYEHPGGFSSPSDARAMARRRLEEIATPRRVVRGAGSLARFVVGANFQLADHPSDGFEGPWMLTRVEHQGAEADMEGTAAPVRYENEFEAVAADLPLRQPRLTRKPIVAGPQTATVVGPSGEEIQVDALGRIRVMFHWDRAKAGDGNTCWIRVAQPWAGPGYGAMFIPRVGHEVVVSFEEGDPDRPLVTQSVYHGTNVPPYALPGDKTRTTIKTNSSPGGGGFNELRFEDKKGQEEIYLHAQKDLDAEVLHDESRTIGNDASLDITRNRTKSVGVDETVTIGANENITIGANLTEAIGATASVSIGGSLGLSVSGESSVQITKSHTEVIGESMTVNIDGDRTETVKKGSSEDVKGSKNVSVGESFSLAVAKDSATAVDGSATEDVGKDMALTVGQSFTMTCGDAKVTVKKNGDIEIQGKSITITGSGPVKVSGSKLEVKSDGTVKVNASGAVKVSGGSVDIN